MFEDRKICREEIESHRGKIAAAIDEFIELLSNRAKTHDKSKLEEPQFSAFAALPRNGHRPDYASKEYLTGLESSDPRSQITTRSNDTIRSISPTGSPA